jgi:hypothetical protein
MDWTFERVDREQPGRLPVRGPVAALAVVLKRSQFPAIGSEAVQQLQHCLLAIGVVLAHALARAVPQYGPRTGPRGTAIHSDR